MELDIPDDIQDLTDMPEDSMSDFEVWVYDVLNYQL